jgi:LacI family transcriptional regulator
VADIRMRDLALQLGLNPSTVSRALDPHKSHLVKESTRLRILQFVAEAGYSLDPAAAGLRRRQTRTVGLLLPDLHNGTLVDVIRVITRVLDRHEQTALIAESMDDADRTQRLLERFRARRVDAVITLAATEADRTSLLEFNRTIPVVLAVRRLSDSNLPTVTCDDVKGGWLVGHHLADLGHRRVAQLQGPHLSATFADRAHGFAMACSERSVQVIGEPMSAEHATVSEGKRVLTQLLRARVEPPTALFAHNDELALGAFEALRENRLNCPGYMSIVGYNDTPIGRDIAVPLTSVRYPTDEVGQRAGELVMELISGTVSEKLVTVYDPNLVVRDSSAPPR